MRTAASYDKVSHQACDDDFLIDVEQVEAAITPCTAAIAPVAPVWSVRRSRSADGDRPSARTQGNGGLCAGAGRALQGSSVREPRPRFGLLVLSTKVLGAYGDGGMVMSNDEAITRLARTLRFYGMEGAYYSERHGYKAQRIFSLPMYPHLKDEEADTVIEVLRDVI